MEEGRSTKAALRPDAEHKHSQGERKDKYLQKFFVLPLEEEDRKVEPPLLRFQQKKKKFAQERGKKLLVKVLNEYLLEKKTFLRHLEIFEMWF